MGVIIIDPPSEPNSAQPEAVILLGKYAAAYKSSYANAVKPLASGPLSDPAYVQAYKDGFTAASCTTGQPAPPVNLGNVAVAPLEDVVHASANLVLTPDGVIKHMT